MSQKPDIKVHNQFTQIQYTLNRRFGYEKQENKLSINQHIEAIPTEYVGCISDQDNKEIIKQLKFSYIKWFAKNNCFALGYNKINNLKKQGHYSIFDLYDWKLHYKKFAVDEAMVGLLNQEYLNKIFGMGSNGGIYSIEKGQEKLEQRPVIETGITQVTDGCFSPNHQKICFSSQDKLIYIYDVQTGLKETLAGHGKEIHTVQWNPNYGLLLSGGEDETIRLWDPMKKEELLNLKRHNLGVRKVRWNRDGNYFISCGKDRQTMLFDLRKVENEIFKLPQSYVDCLMWHPKYENVFLTGDQNGCISMWNTYNMAEPMMNLKKIDTMITDIGIDSTGQFMGVIRAKPQIDPKTNQPDLIEIFKTK